MEQQKVTKGKKGISSIIASVLVHLAIIFTIIMLLFVIVHIFKNGLPTLINQADELFAIDADSKNNSMMPAIVNTIELILIVLVVSVPIGVGTAIYTVEYAKPGNKFVKATRLMTETLQGIPSIIFGLFGMLFFSNFIGWGNAILSGAMTMTLMVLPLIIRSTEEALMAVPMGLREASYGLGARKLRTVFSVVLPAASMGIFSGIILAIGRIVGETAALIYTAGSMAQYAGPMDNGRTLAIHLYMLSVEGHNVPEAYATGVVLVIVVVIINAISTSIEHKIKEKEEGEE